MGRQSNSRPAGIPARRLGPSAQQPALICHLDRSSSSIAIDPNHSRTTLSRIRSLTAPGGPPSRALPRAQGRPSMSGSSGSRVTLLQRALVSLQVFLLVATMRHARGRARRTSRRPSRVRRRRAAEPTRRADGRADAPSRRPSRRPTTRSRRPSRQPPEPTSEPTDGADGRAHPRADGRRRARRRRPSPSDLDDYPPGGLVDADRRALAARRDASHIYVNDHVGEHAGAAASTSSRTQSGAIFDQIQPARLVRRRVQRVRAWASCPASPRRHSRTLASS